MGFRGVWDLIDEINDPVVTLISVFDKNEPFSKRMIDLLEKAFPKAKDEEIRFQIALVLYRYKRESGKTYLIEMLRKKKSLLAGIILAENREEEALLDLIRIFKDTEFKDFKNRTPDRFLWSLGRFGSKIDKVLETGLLRRSRRYDYAVAYCLGQHSISEFGRRSLRAISVDKTAGIGFRFIATVALLSFDPDNRGLQESFFNFFDNFNESEIIDWFPVMQVLARHSIQLDRVSKIFEPFIQKFIDQEVPPSGEFEVEIIRFFSENSTSECSFSGFFFS